jgi:hypothetical protein
LGRDPSTALSTDTIFEPAPKVKFLSATQFMSYRGITFSKALALASWMVGDGLTCLTCSVASRNLNTAPVSYFVPRT